MATRERMPGKTANKYFDVAFFILQRSEMLASVTRHFAGAAIWRAYGLDASVSYSGILDFDQERRWMGRTSAGWVTASGLARRIHISIKLNGPP